MFALFATYAPVYPAVYSGMMRVHETSDGSGVVSQITAICDENETSAASTASSTSAMASLTTGGVAILYGKRRSASLLARPKPIKAESRKHVVNRPHFTVASRRISRYLSF